MAVDGSTRDASPIDKGRVYTIAQFCRATGIGRTGLRAAERRGLRTSRVGGRKFVSGEAWFEYLKREGTMKDE
jgi:hypothetical protein